MPRGGAVGLSGGFLTGSSTGSGRTLSSSSRSGTVVGGRGIGLVGTFELLPMPDISLSDRRSTAVGDVPSNLFWALLNTKEFAFNH